MTEGVPQTLGSEDGLFSKVLRYEWLKPYNKEMKICIVGLCNKIWNSWETVFNVKSDISAMHFEGTRLEVEKRSIKGKEDSLRATNMLQRCIQQLPNQISPLVFFPTVWCWVCITLKHSFSMPLAKQQKHICVINCCGISPRHYFPSFLLL